MAEATGLLDDEEPTDGPAELAGVCDAQRRPADGAPAAHVVRDAGVGPVPTDEDLLVLPAREHRRPVVVGCHAPELEGPHGHAHLHVSCERRRAEDNRVESELLSAPTHDLAVAEVSLEFEARHGVVVVKVVQRGVFIQDFKMCYRYDYQPTIHITIIHKSV